MTRETGSGRDHVLLGDAALEEALRVRKLEAAHPAVRSQVSIEDDEVLVLGSESHQSVRDISLLAALPEMTIVQPGSSEETRALLRWAVEQSSENVAIRLAIGPSPRRIELSGDVMAGRGSTLHEGADAILFAYGPVMLHEALTAAELLDQQGLGLAIVNMPWLNRFDEAWLAQAIGPYEQVLVLEDHAPIGGLGDGLRRGLEGRSLIVFGVEGWPACGAPAEALRAHGLDGASLAERIETALGLTEA